MICLIFLVISFNGLFSSSAFGQPELDDSAPRSFIQREPVGYVERIQGKPRVKRLLSSASKDVLESETRAGRRLKRSLKESFVSLASLLFERDILTTENSTRLHLRFIEHTYLELGEKTELEIERIRPAQEVLGQKPSAETFYAQGRGLVRYTVPHAKPEARFAVHTVQTIFIVETPSDFFLEVKPNETILSVRSGKVRVQTAVQGVNKIYEESKVLRVLKSGDFRDQPPLTTQGWESLKKLTAVE